MIMNSRKWKIILAIFVGFMVLHALIKFPFPPWLSDVDEILQVFGGCTLLVLTPVILFRTLRSGAAHVGVSNFFQLAEIALGICLLVYLEIGAPDPDKEDSLLFCFGLLFVLHGIIRLPRKNQKKDEEQKLASNNEPE
jgi:uncharacterized membrane protein HdeD (DUF308 family)